MVAARDIAVGSLSEMLTRTGGPGTPGVVLGLDLQNAGRDDLPVRSHTVRIAHPWETVGSDMVIAVSSEGAPFSRSAPERIRAGVLRATGERQGTGQLAGSSRVRPGTPSKWRSAET